MREGRTKAQSQRFTNASLRPIREDTSGAEKNWGMATGTRGNYALERGCKEGEKSNVVEVLSKGGVRGESMEIGEKTPGAWRNKRTS